MSRRRNGQRRQRRVFGHPARQSREDARVAGQRGEGKRSLPVVTFVCPREGCDYAFMHRGAWMDFPRCPRHGAEMYPR